MIFSEVVGYCRVSTENGDIDVQKRALDTWSQDNNVSLNRMFSDQIPGTQSVYNRIGLFSALTYCTLHKIDIIVVSDLEKLGKTKSVLKQLCRISKRHKVKFYSIKEDILIYDGMPENVFNQLKAVTKSTEKSIEYTLKQMEKGRRKAMKNGVKMGRKVGSVKTDEQFLEEYSDVFKVLKKGYSIRETARRTGVSPSTVQRLKKRFKVEA